MIEKCRHFISLGHEVTAAMAFYLEAEKVWTTGVISSTVATATLIRGCATFAPALAAAKASVTKTSTAVTIVRTDPIFEEAITFPAGDWA